MNWSHCPRPPSPFLPSTCIHEVSIVGGELFVIVIITARLSTPGNFPTRPSWIDMHAASSQSVGIHTACCFWGFLGEPKGEQGDGAPPPPFSLCCNALQGRARSIVSIAESPEAPSPQRFEGSLAPFLTLDSRCVNTYPPLRKMRWCIVTSSWRI